MHVVLVEPQIPPNTGNIARLCAALGLPLHLVEPLGFSLSDKHLKRAGLDYWKWVDLRVHASLDRVLGRVPTERCHFFSKNAATLHWDASYSDGDYLVFGNELAGLPGELVDRFPDRFRRLVMNQRGVRSLNLSSAVSAVVYEAQRQLAFRRLRS